MPPDILKEVFMIISKEEFYDMGFEIDKQYEGLLENCIKRAEFVLGSLTDGRAGIIAMSETPAADFVKQAAAFQTYDILKDEITLAKSESESSADSKSSKSDERVSIGDFTYSTGTSNSTSNKSSSSSGEGSSSKTADNSKTVVRLLRAAGCFYSGMEVAE